MVGQGDFALDPKLEFEVKDHYTLENIDHFSQFGPNDGHSWPRLPTGSMRLFHQISHIEGSRKSGVKLFAQYRVIPRTQFFLDHFPGYPVMPGALLIDAMLQLTGFAGAWLGYRGVGMALGSDRIRFKTPVTPRVDTVHYVINLTKVQERSDAVYLTGDGKAFADENLAAVAHGLQVIISRSIDPGAAP